MALGLLGRKIGMTQLFSPAGDCIPVTLIQAGPCLITQIKSIDKDGYQAVQLGFEELKAKKISKPLKGHYTKQKLTYCRHLQEFRVEDVKNFTVGNKVEVDIFKPQDQVSISGVSKGRGFAGVIKRHKFSGGPKTHGSRFQRAPGSMGSSADPSHVFKGKKIPGHMGNCKVTICNLEIVNVDPSKALLIIKGAVPGPNQGLLRIVPARS